MATQNSLNDIKQPLDDGGFDFLGKELEPRARVWNVYRDEVTADDKAHGFERWTQTLDVLLIFAGLFSAVVTAFLIDSYKLLQKPDKDDFVAAALYALVVATNNSALLRGLPEPASLSSVPSSGERWVNALWFTSLIIALSVALLAILAKQWLQEFHRRLEDRDGPGATRTPSHEWTRKRWFYVQGMHQKWPTDDFITYILPLMLHIALFLFLAGLFLFLWSIDSIVSLVVLVLSGCLVAFDIGCTLLSLLWPDAPTATPLLNHVLALTNAVLFVIIGMSIGVLKFLERRHLSPLDLVELSTLTFSQSPPTADGEAVDGAAGPRIVHSETSASLSVPVSVAPPPAATRRPTSAAELPTAEPEYPASQSVSAPTGRPPAASAGPFALQSETSASRPAPALARPAVPVQSTVSHAPLPLPVQSQVATSPLVRRVCHRLEATLAQMKRARSRCGIIPNVAVGRDESLLADILEWLIVTCTSENAIMIAFQAVGALNIDSDSKHISRLQEATIGMSALTHFGTNKTPSTLDAIRAIRSELVLGRGTWRGTRLVLNIPDTMLNALKNVPHSDALLFHASLQGFLLSNIDDVLGQLDSESITTRSARLLLRCKGPMDASVLISLLAVLDYGALDKGDFDRIFALFASWDAKCTCTAPSLLCLMPFMAAMWRFELEGEELWDSSLPAFIASRILRYCSRSGNHVPGVRHRHHRFDDDESLLDFLHHPGWLHPMTCPTNTTNTNVLVLKGEFPTGLYIGSGDERVDMAISTLFRMLPRLRTRPEPVPPLASLPRFTPENFRFMLRMNFYWNDADLNQGVAKLLLVKSLRFFFYVSSMEEDAGRTYYCTDALLAIAAGFSWMKRQWHDTDIKEDMIQLMGTIRRCSWPDGDWSNPMITHLAQHIRELVPDYSRELSTAYIDSGVYKKTAADWLPLVELIANANPCTQPDCPGTTQPELRPPRRRVNSSTSTDDAEPSITSEEVAPVESPPPDSAL